MWHFDLNKYFIYAFVPGIAEILDPFKVVAIVLCLCDISKSSLSVVSFIKTMNNVGPSNVPNLILFNLELVRLWLRPPSAQANLIIEGLSYQEV